MIINGRKQDRDVHQKLLPKPHSQLQASSPHSNTQQRNTLKSHHFISVAHSCPLICKSHHLWVASKASKLEQSGTLPSKESDNWERTLSGGEGCVCVCVCVELRTAQTGSLHASCPSSSLTVVPTCVLQEQNTHTWTLHKDTHLSGAEPRYVSVYMWMILRWTVFILNMLSVLRYTVHC